VRAVIMCIPVADVAEVVCRVPQEPPFWPNSVWYDASESHERRRNGCPDSPKRRSTRHI